MPGESGDEDMVGEVLEGLDVADFRVSLPGLELVDGKGAGGCGDAEVGAGHLGEEVDVQDGRWGGQRLDDVAAWGTRAIRLVGRISLLFHASTVVVGGDGYVHMVADDSHQDETAIAPLTLAAFGRSVVGRRACRFFLIGLLEMVGADHGILGIQGEKLDAAGWQVQPKGRE